MKPIFLAVLGIVVFFLIAIWLLFFASIPPSGIGYGCETIGVDFRIEESNLVNTRLNVSCPFTSQEPPVNVFNRDINGPILDDGYGTVKARIELDPSCYDTLQISDVVLGTYAKKPDAIILDVNNNIYKCEKHGLA